MFFCAGFEGVECEARGVVGEGGPEGGAHVIVFVGADLFGAAGGIDVFDGDLILGHDTRLTQIWLSPRGSNGPIGLA